MGIGDFHVTWTSGRQTTWRGPNVEAGVRSGQADEPHIRLWETCQFWEASTVLNCIGDALPVTPSQSEALPSVVSPTVC